MKLIVPSLFLWILTSCGSSSGSSKADVNPHAQAHAQMHQKLYQEELNKEITRQLEKLSGRYSGNLPCSDCEGIKFELVLKPDLSYSSRAEYVDKSQDPIVKDGFYTLSENGKIKLDQNTDNLQFFQAEENQLKVLDMNGYSIPGEPGEKYFLKYTGN
jgi:uncharacterized lipoprotein NlpE involved in copper resistance